MVVRRGEPDKEIAAFGRDAAMVVVDDGYVRVETRWRRSAAAVLKCPLIEVATNVIVPVTVVSPKEEYAATLRPKIYRHVDGFLALSRRPPAGQAGRAGCRELGHPEHGNGPGEAGHRQDDQEIAVFPRCQSEAEKRLRAFVGEKLAAYAEIRNDPRPTDIRIEPYLHFGQISPLAVAWP